MRIVCDSCFFVGYLGVCVFFFFKQKTAVEMRISDWSSDVCSSDLGIGEAGFTPALVSMISDRFNANKRAAVFSLIAIGVPIGGALAAVLGGAMAQAFRWRLAFVAVGLPGLVLALLFFRTVPEPARAEIGRES